MRYYVSAFVYPGTGAAVAVGPRVTAGSLARGKRGERWARGRVGGRGTRWIILTIALERTGIKGE
jgi:hypothetical protein